MTAANWDAARIPMSETNSKIKKANKKEKIMSQKLLRKFIAEAISLEAMDAESPYLPELGNNAEYAPYQMGQGAVPAREDYVEEFLVQLKADDGVITDQHRVSESYLREFIREAAKNKKKVTKPQQ